jgi:hypothetical protein
VKLPVLVLACWLTATLSSIAAPLPLDSLTKALPEYANREYARQKLKVHLVLSGNIRVAEQTANSQVLDVLTLERFRDLHGDTVPVLIQRRIHLGLASDQRWWLSDVQSTVQPIPESLDAKFGPYLEDMPTPRTAPPSTTGMPTATHLQSAFAQAISRWLRDIQYSEKFTTIP